jgi:hypothetical protein
VARRSVLLAVSLAIAVFPARASTQLRLDEEGDRLAFRAWFALLADAAYYRPVAEVTDCAALVRYAARESLRAHTPEWLRLAKLPVAAGLPELTHRPAAVGNHVPLFRVSSDPHAPYTEFADARTMVRYNARLIARDVGAARPGDLLYYQQPSQNEPDHLMIFIGESRFDTSAGDFVVYHTGKDDRGGPGEVRKVRLADLLRHPSPRWRPLASNPNFVGVFRLVMMS